MNFIFTLFLIVCAQILTYFQLQSQFFWVWAKTHPIFMAFLGWPISLLYIQFTNYSQKYFGETWPGRLIGFAVGAIVFALLSSTIMKEELGLKTIICLILSASILLIQLFWK